MAFRELEDFLALAGRINDGGDLTPDEARELLELDPASELVYDLFYAAHRVRRKFHGNKVTFCSIVAAKFGTCSEDCKFCAQSSHYETGVNSHSMMEPEEVERVTRDAASRGASSFGIVNSGRGRAKKNGRRSSPPSRR